MYYYVTFDGQHSIFRLAKLHNRLKGKSYTVKVQAEDTEHARVVVFVPCPDEDFTIGPMLEEIAEAINANQFGFASNGLEAARILRRENATIN